MRRRVYAVVIVCALVELAAPVRAFAFLGWLDRLSGPGPFVGGWRFQARLLCLMKRVPWSDAATATQTALAATRAVSASPGQGATSIEGRAAAIARDALVQISESDRRKTARALAQASDALARDSNTSAVRQWWTEVAALWWAVSEKPVSPLPFPVIDAQCGSGPVYALKTLPHREPVASIDLDFQHLHFTDTGVNPYAKGEQIRETIIEPRFSWRVLGPPFDVVDIGAGFGMYRFSSSAFDAVTGLVLEPVRFDFHAPAKWTRTNRWTRLAGVVTFSWGVVLFPAGFDANAFGSTGDKARAIPGGEAVRTRAIFIDLSKLAPGL